MQLNKLQISYSETCKYLPKHLIILNGGQPEAVGVCIVVAGATAMTLNEGSRTELLQTGPRRSQSLTGALSTCTGVLKQRQKAWHIDHYLVVQGS